MLCASCGAPIEAGATFCHRCGATLAAGTAPPMAAAAMPAPDAGAALREGASRAFRHFGAFFVTQGIFVLLAAAISIGTSAFFMGTAYAEMTTAMAAEDVDALVALLPQVAVVGGTTTLVTLLLRGIGHALGIVVADGLERGETIGLGEAWSRAAPRIGALLLTLGLVGLAAIACVLAGLPLFFLVVPVLAGIGFAVYLMVVWALAGPVSMLETGGATENLRRAAELSRGERGALFLALAAIVLLAALPGMIASIALARFAGAEAVAGPGMVVANGVVGAAASLVASIVLSSFLVRAYRQRVPLSP